MQYLNNYEKGGRWERRCQPYSTNPMLKIFRLRSMNEDFLLIPNFFDEYKGPMKPKNESGVFRMTDFFEGENFRLRLDNVQCARLA